MTEGGGGALVAHTPALPFQQRFTAEQVDLIKRQICRSPKRMATDDELAMFLGQCERTGLDPFAKQIYAVFRWDKASGGEKLSIQTGIDGFRLIAERTGKYAGQTPEEWCDHEGNWTTVWLKDDHPFAARVGVYKTGSPVATFATVRWSAYVQTDRAGKPTKFWQQMGPEQLAKCAEAKALRKAFPHELSGLYADVEMTQAENHDDIPDVEVIEAPPALTDDAAIERHKVILRLWEGLEAVAPEYANASWRAKRDAWVESAQHSHETLDQLIAHMEKLLDAAKEAA